MVSRFSKIVIAQPHYGRRSTPREPNLKFFAQEGFATLCACYYDADDLKNVEGWVQRAGGTPRVRGFMYTPWQKKYALLPEFGDMVSKAETASP